MQAPVLLYRYGNQSCQYPAGGPGPEISLPVGRFTPGVPVRVVVTLTTDGGQSGGSTVTFTARDDPALRCSDSVAGAVITLSCQGLPAPVASALCSIDGGTQFACNFYLTWIKSSPCIMHVNFLIGNTSSLEINVLDFAPGSHVLIITFTDVDGNAGSAQYTFTRATRPGE